MTRRIAVLPGDGVGAEVVAGPVELLEAIAAAGRIELTGPWPVGASAFGELGTGLPASTLAACDDSDLRNVAHCGTALTAAGLSLAERTGATPRELLLAMVVGYEAAGRIGEARAGGRGGVHASQIVAFGAAAASGRRCRREKQR